MSNLDGKLQKIEKDFTQICDVELPKAEALALVGFTHVIQTGFAFHVLDLDLDYIDMLNLKINCIFPFSI
jgi:hypothetical protein